MSKYGKDLKALIRKLAGEAMVQAFEAEVTAVDEAKETCTVLPADDAEIFNVRMTAVLGEKASYFLPVPKVGSMVVVAILNGNENTAYIAQYSELDKVLLKCDEITFNDGLNGGLIIWDNLLTDLKKVNGILTAMKSVFDAWVPPGAPDAGAVLVAAMKSALSTLSTPEYNNITNDKVKH